MVFKISPEFKACEKEIQLIFKNFDVSGDVFIKGERNQIKLFEVQQQKINVKSFKKPHKLNQLIYRYIRKSKARRSFEFARILLKKGIGTPAPVAFEENYTKWGLQKSFYASIHQNYDLTFRELVEIPDYPDHENILRQFTQFCYKMHQNGIEFKDHSPGNTLIKNTENQQYKFFLVDLNRMKFHDFMDMELRMKNLCRLTPKKEMTDIIAEEYAKLSSENPERLKNLLWNYTFDFQRKYHKKLYLKNKLKSFLPKFKS